MKSHVPAVNLKFLITTRLFSIFRKKGLSPAGEKKSELLGQKSLTSTTCRNFEIFDHNPQLDIKFLNP